MFRVTALMLFIFSLAASAAAETLLVTVLDPQGAAVPTALVMAGSEAPRRVNADGSVEIDTTTPVLVRVTAPGFEMTTRRVDTYPANGLIITVEPAPVYETLDVVVRHQDVEAEAGPVVSSAVEIDQAGARTVFDAVDQLVPSAFVTRRGVMGYGISTNGTGQVTIRGVGSSPNTGILVVVDGRPDYMGLMGHPLPDFYSLTDAESVSVTKGPASVLYGSNAMGGAIDIKPADPTEGFHTELSGGLGSYWTGQYRLKHGAGFDKWFYHLTAGVDHTDGDRPVSHFRNQDGTAAVGYDLSRVWRTTLRGRYGHFLVEDPGALSAGPGPYASVGRGGFSWNLENTTGRTWGNTSVFGSWGHHWIDDGWRSNDRTTGARVHQNVLLTPDLLADFGGDFVDYGGLGRNLKSSIDYGRHSATSGAGFGRLQWSPTARLRLNTGLRYEHNSIFGGITVPEFGATVRIAEGYSFNVSAARGFRNPTIRELYLFPAPNPELEPERMWNYQATIGLQPHRRLAASLTGYYANLNNLIVVTGRFPNLQLLNSGQSLNRGLEASARWRISSRLSFNGGYAWLHATNLPPLVPRHKATYSAEIDLKRAFLHIGGMTVGSRFADSSRTAELAGYTVPTLKVMVPVRERLTLFCTVDNWIDEDYQVIAGYPMPGVNAAAGFEVRW